MNKSEKQNLLVGAIVTIIISGLAIAILYSGRSGDAKGEYIILTELPVLPEIKTGDVVVHNGKIVGMVQKVSPSVEASKTAVRASIQREVFKRIGENAFIWAEISPDGKTVLQLDPGAGASAQRFIKIKAVKGVNNTRMK